MVIQIATLSEIGGRTSNDDTVRYDQGRNRSCVFVGDGLGSYRGGSMASQAAAEAVLAAGRKSSLLTDTALLAAAEEANQAVRKVQEDNRGTMKTTLVALALEDGVARWMHVGDSRLYHFRNGKIVHITQDHSVSQMAVLMGEISPEQIRFHEDRNRVLRALGSDNTRPELSAPTKLSGGQNAFLLCTDGFWEYVYEEEMEQALAAAASPQEWLDAMTALLRSRAPEDSDNYTAAAVFCGL